MGRKKCRSLQRLRGAFPRDPAIQWRRFKSFRRAGFDDASTVTIIAIYLFDPLYGDLQGARVIIVFPFEIVREEVKLTFAEGSE